MRLSKPRVKSVTLAVLCPCCKRESAIEIEYKEFQQLQSGEIQVGQLSNPPEERELLITGICPKCWDKMFAEEE